MNRRGSYQFYRQRRRHPIIWVAALLLAATACLFAAAYFLGARFLPPAHSQADAEPAFAEQTTPDDAPLPTHTPAASQDAWITELLSGTEAWALVLVNSDNALPDGHDPSLETLANGLQVDVRAAGPLTAMLNAARAEGLSPIVCSAYRPISYQRTLFAAKAAELQGMGLTPERADEEARRHVAYPGTSEHNLGLAVDIVSSDYQLLDNAQAFTPEAIWLAKHAAEYGFILRYPVGKEAVTGVIYEPWHFRYVGVEAARALEANGLTLEEFWEAALLH